MSTASIIANYIEHNRCLGKCFASEETILTAFGRSVGNVPMRNIRPAMISQFLDRNGTSEETVRKKHHVLAGFFRFAVTRRRLRASPMPSYERKHGAASYTPYIYSEAGGYSQRCRRRLVRVPISMRTHCARFCCSCTVPDCVEGKLSASSSKTSIFRNL
jgi:hypothetical protein